jgi:oleandomycin transport system ATP-binding protein
MMSAIQVECITKNFGDTHALNAVNLEVPAGSVMGLLGPNGAGKTTLIRILSTLLRPDGGRALVNGHDVVREARMVRRSIGLAGQYAAVDEDLSGKENLYMVARLLNLSPRMARRRADDMLDRFGLAEAARQRVRTYSGGMRRRLDLAVSLMGRPPLVFLDEPTTGLDPQSRNGLWEMVRSLAEDGVTVLLTTQYMEEAEALAHAVTVIDHGQVIAAGTVAELRATIGGQVLFVRPGVMADLLVVRQTLASLLGIEVVRSDEGQVCASIAGEADLQHVLRAIASLEVPIKSVESRMASLDEVFLALTGTGRSTARVAANGHREI